MEDDKNSHLSKQYTNCSRSECFQYWVYGDHAIDLRRKLVGWFLVYTSSTCYISDE